MSGTIASMACYTLFKGEGPTRLNTSPGDDGLALKLKSINLVNELNKRIKFILGITGYDYKFISEGYDIIFILHRRFNNQNYVDKYIVSDYMLKQGIKSILEYIKINCLSTLNKWQEIDKIK